VPIRLPQQRSPGRQGPGGGKEGCALARVTVVQSLTGTMLQEFAPTQATEVAQAPRGWRYSVERKATRVPERKHQGTGRAGCCRKGRD